MTWFKKNEEKADPASLATAVQGNTLFALDLYRHLRGTEGSLFFSPYSISTALAMTWAGARGETQAQMAQALHFLLDQQGVHPAFARLGAKLAEVEKKGQVQLKVANSLWPSKGFKFQREYLALVRKFYGVRITPVDFGEEEAARRTINAWVEARTEDKIKDLIAEGILDALTRLVLVNAIYFKGAWASPFDQNLSEAAPFRTAPDQEVQVMMMTSKHTFGYAEAQDLQVLELPYAGDDLSMLVLLPRQADGLAKMEESLSVENLDRWTASLAETEVQASLPRFELSFPFRLDDTLKAMGMVAAFFGEADFSGMDGSRELFIGAVLHKAFVEVNEQGTEAAAATAVIMQRKAFSFPAVVFQADHPFVFLIRENSTGSILFLGRLVNPASS
jgi:serpin B